MAGSVADHGIGFSFMLRPMQKVIGFSAVGSSVNPVVNRRRVNSFTV